MSVIRILLLSLLTLPMVSCGQTSASEQPQELSAEAFKKAIESSDVTVLDVRTPGEVANGKIEGAVHINVNGDDFMQQASKLDKSKTIYVYCASGYRSGRAQKMLQKEGFKVVNLTGGITAWIAAGYKTVQ